MTIGVLIVEDEFLLRWDAAEFFEEAGFTVYQASHADEAIALLELHADIRAVFTDINMPGSMDGLKLAHTSEDVGRP
jgi:CheY-like chemotaxis protein